MRIAPPFFVTLVNQRRAEIVDTRPTLAQRILCIDEYDSKP